MADHRGGVRARVAALLAEAGDAGLTRVEISAGVLRLGELHGEVVTRSGVRSYAALSQRIRTVLREMEHLGLIRREPSGVVRPINRTELAAIAASGHRPTAVP